MSDQELYLMHMTMQAKSGSISHWWNRQDTLLVEIQWLWLGILPCIVTAGTVNEMKNETTEDVLLKS